MNGGRRSVPPPSLGRRAPPTPALGEPLPTSLPSRSLRSSMPPASALTPPSGAQDMGALDVMSQNAGQNVRKVHARELASAVVTGLFRLVKLATLHSLDNQAMVRQVDEMVQLVSEYGQRTEHNVSILFAHGSVFVGGQLLRANRGIYEGALELGDLLHKIDAAEIGIMRDATAGDFYAFASSMAEALRQAKPAPIRRPSPRIMLRSMSAAALLREGMVSSAERTDPNVQVSRIYASAVVIMRRFLEDMRRGKYELPQRVKRVAQRLVDLSTGETPAFLGVTSARNANHDDAGRAVNTAILALAMTRQVSTDMVQLSRVAMAALLFDCARARNAGVVGMTGPAASAVIPQLSEQQELAAPAGTAVVLTALGRVNEPSVMRTVIAFEAQWERRKVRLGPVYRGLRQPSLQARIIANARAYNDLLTPSPGQQALTADEAIAKLQSEATEPTDRTVLRLLVGALGIFPTGTVVQLSTGEVALIVRAPSNPALYAQPKVQIVMDASGGHLARPIELDLSVKRRPGEPARQITKVLATSDDPQSAQLRAWASSASGGAAASSANAAPAAREQVFAMPPPPPPAPAPEPARAPQARHVEVRAVEPTEAAPDSRRAHGLDLPSSPPTAEGDLKKTPFAHLLVYMLDRRLTGTTLLRGEEGTIHAVYFHEGSPAKVRTGTPIAPLDRVLLDQGLLDEATLRSTMLEIKKRNILHGRYLVMKGLLDRDTVIAALRVQLLRKVTYLFELPASTRYAYYEGKNLIASWGGPELMPCEPLAVIMGGIRQRATDPIVDGTIARLGSRTLSIHTDAEVRRFMLQRDERAVVDMLRARPSTLSALLESGVAQDRVVRYMVYALAVTRHLDFGKPPIGVQRDWPAVLDQTTGQVIDMGRSTIAPAAPPTRAQEPLITDVEPPSSRLPRPTTKMQRVREPAPPAEKQAAQATPKPSAISSPATPPVTPRPSATDEAPHSKPTTKLPRVTAPDAEPPSSRVPIELNRDVMPAGRAVEAKPAPRAPEPTPPPPAAKPVSPEPPPAKPKPDNAARRAEIQRRSASIDGEDFFQMLGVPRDATNDEVKAAFMSLVKVWHPDRLPADLADLKPDTARIFARISEANQTLSDPEKRAGYARMLEQGTLRADDPSEVARAVDAALEFQKAEILLKKNDLVGAETLAKRAAEADPEQPEYKTLLAWIQALRRPDPPGAVEGVPTRHFDDLIKVFDDVLGAEPRYERALYYRGMLNKRAGRLERAIRDFKLVAELNPKNIDAVREVRLFEMRRRTGPSPKDPPDGGGLFGKFFKR